MGTRPIAAIAVVSRPYEVIATPLACIDNQPPITAWEYLGLITSPHMVTLIHRSRHALFPLHILFGLYHALTILYPSRHALLITKHLSYNAPSPGFCPQPPTGHRPQVTAGLLANSNLPSLGRCSTSTRFHSRCVHGHQLSNERFRAITRPHVTHPPNLADDIFMGTCYQTKCLRAVTRPHYVDIAKLNSVAITSGL